MRKIFLILLTKTLLALSFYATTLAHAQSDNFNYATAVGLILYVDGGGHVFQRPDYDEPRNFFIIIYGIVGKYAVQMQPQHDGLALDIPSLPVEEKILLINHEAQKLLFLGDHWIGDGQKFSIMETGDYLRLKQLFAETRKARSEPTKEAALESYSDSIHKKWGDGSEGFYREFYFPDPKPLPVSSATDITTNQAAQDIRIEESNSGRETKTDTQPHQKEQDKGEKKKTVTITEEKQPHAANSLTKPSVQQKMLANPVPNQEIGEAGEAGEAGEDYFKPWLWVLLLIGFSLVGYWLRRKTK